MGGERCKQRKQLTAKPLVPARALESSLSVSAALVHCRAEPRSMLLALWVSASGRSLRGCMEAASAWDDSEVKTLGGLFSSAPGA